MQIVKCWSCGSENLALMRTLDLKYCCCGQWMPWRLDAGQKPVGYVKPVVERELATSEVVESESANCAQQNEGE
jgi:hypothetical protein